jgi:hypothetical protein
MAVQLVITSNGVPYPQMMLVGLHSMSGRKKEEKEGWGMAIQENWKNVFFLTIISMATLFK